MVNIHDLLKMLKREYPNARIALNYNTNFELLVAVILSAQCTDERVNMVTPNLFKRFPGVRDFAECRIEELEKAIFSTGFYRNKSKNIKAMAQILLRDFGGEVPSDMEKLLTLPGVARKTANVMMHSAFDNAVGIVVDTHVARLAGLLGLVPTRMSEKKEAVKIEEELKRLVPRKDWGILPHLLILHGRKVCIARRPRCIECVLNKICPSSKI